MFYRDKLLSHLMVQCVRQMEWYIVSPYLTLTFCLHLSVTSEKLIKTQRANSRCKNWSHHSTKGATTVWIPVWHSSGHWGHSICFNLQEFIFRTKDNSYAQTLQCPKKNQVLVTELPNTHITVDKSWEWLSIWFSVGFSQTNVYDPQPLYSRLQKQLPTALGNQYYHFCCSI